MNARIARKLALARHPVRRVMAQGLFEATGSIALAVGAFRPRLLIDPRAFGEHRVLRTFVEFHERSHILCGHLPVLFAIRWLGIFAMAGSAGGIAAILAWARGTDLAGTWGVLGIFGAVGAWLEARFGLLTMHVRAQAETEADAVALSVMPSEHFAAAVKAFFAVTKRRRGLDGYVDRVVYGASWRERVERQGLVAKEAEEAVPA